MAQALPYHSHSFFLVREGPSNLETFFYFICITHVHKNLHTKVPVPLITLLYTVNKLT